MKSKLFSALLSMLLVLTMLVSLCVPAFAEMSNEETSELGALEAPEVPGGFAAGAQAPVTDPSAPAPIPVPEETPEEEPASDLDIKARTLALKDNVYIKYAVPATEDDVKMMFWTETPDGGEYKHGTHAAEAEPSYQQVVDGVLCNIYQYTGMQDHQMTDNLYARSYTVEDDGSYTYGKVDKYSVLQYAYNKKHADKPDEKLNEVLDDLLDSGAEAQTKKNYKTDGLANEPHSSIHVVDDVLADGFADMLHPDKKGEPTFDRYLRHTGNLTFYFEGGIEMTGYHIIESYVYYFDAATGAKKNVTIDDRHFDKHGRVDVDREFMEFNGNVYYIVLQVIVYQYYVIDDSIYYFGDDGAMRTDTTVDGNHFGSTGALEGDSVFADCGDKVYYIVDNVIVYIYIYIEEVLYLQLGDMLYPTTDYNSAVSESDNDEDISNNESLEGVTCIATIESLGISFTITSDANGNFSFPHLPMLEIVFVFVIEGYIETTVTVDMSTGEEVPEEIILDRNVSNTLSGRVTIADTDTNFNNNQSLEGATVTIDRVSSTNPFTATTTTDANGRYTFGELTAGVYKLVVVLEQYIIVNQTVYIRHNETNIENTPIEAIPGDGLDETAQGGAAGIIKDARTGYAVVGVTVYIREGLNNTTGRIVATVVTDANGCYEVTGLKPGNYTAQLKDERTLDNEDFRFATITVAIKVLASITIVEQNATISNNVGLDIDGMRVVLTWGSTPSDLDSHMQVDLVNGQSDHIYFGYMESQLGVSLDVDDTSSYGPETITVSSVAEGVYRYYVFNFSHDYSSDLSNSGAKIEIYFGGSATPVYTLYVPQGSGYTWNVFTYNSVTGDFVINNTITYD